MRLSRRLKTVYEGAVAAGDWHTAVLCLQEARLGPAPAKNPKRSILADAPTGSILRPRHQ